MDLNAPISVIVNENVEFEILIDRINAQCMRIESDNLRLDKINSKVEHASVIQVSVKGVAIGKSIRERNDVRKNQEEQRGEKVTAVENQKIM